jgi:superfamily II helicase
MIDKDTQPDIPFTWQLVANIRKEGEKMATKTAPKLLTASKWQEQICGEFGEKRRYGIDGLVALEQAMLQSEHHKICVDCLGKDNLVHITTRALIQSTDYYMCQDCLDYYNNKG